MKSFKLIFAGMALASMAFVFFAFRPSAPAAGKLSTTITEWERAKTYTKEYLDAATEEAYAFKPTAEMRSFAEQMLHLSEANYGLVATATGKTSPVSFGQLEKGSQKSKAEVTKAVLDSYDFVINALKGMDEQKLAANVKIFNFEMTGETAIQKAFEHQTHHRGQTTVYLRLKGIAPPNEKLF